MNLVSFRNPLISGAFMILMAVIVAILHPAYAQTGVEDVKVRGWDHGSYGRLVFDWPQPEEGSIVNDGKTLTVSFKKPFTARLDRAVKLLGKYIANPRFENERKSLLFDLVIPTRASSFSNGTAFVVDMRPAEQAPEKLSTNLINIRVGRHDRFVRMVFEWPGPVDYRVATNRSAVAIHFQQQGRVDVKALEKILIGGLANPQVKTGENSLDVSLDMPTGTKVRHFRDGGLVVLDFLNIRSAEAGVAKLEQTNEVKPTEGEGTGALDGNQGNPAQDNPAAAPGEPVKLVPGAAEQTAAAGEQSSQTADTPAPDTQISDTQAAGADQNAAPVLDAPQLPAPAQNGGATDVMPTDQQSALDAAQASGKLVLKRDDASNIPQGKPIVSFSFDWPESVGAASFRRGDYIWIVFDRRAPLDLAPLRLQGAPIIDKIEQLPIAGGTVLRLRTRPDINPTVRKEGFNWIVDFRKQPMRPREQLPIVAEADRDNGPQLIFPTEEAGGAVNFPDPEIGDRIRVATYKSPGTGVEGYRRYPEFDILPSAQGVALVQKSDGLLFERNFDGYVLSSPDGLQFSAVSPDAPKTRTGGRLSSRHMFELEKWQHREYGDYIQGYQTILGNIVQVPKEKRNDARLELAQFYVAWGRGAEAVGILNAIIHDDKIYGERPEVKSLMGAASFLNRDFVEARQDLGDPRLDPFSESAIWRGAVLAETGNWKEAADEFRLGDPMLKRYPYPLKGQLGLIRTEAALATRDLGTATAWLDELDRDFNRLTPHQQGDVRYHQARMALTRNDLDKAKELWTDLVHSDDRKNAARSEYALINLELKQGEIDDKQATDRLEKLKFDWRGDRFELNVLRRLGELYFDKGDYWNGLATYRTAVTYFPDDPVAQQLAQDMSDTFRKLYLDGEADAMPPLRAVALYDEFRELTPAGPDGDVMVEKLADRLVAVDLLDRAEELLEHQVRFRLQGEERARVGAKLAVVYLFDNKPDKALDALSRTDFPQLPRYLEDDRRRIRAKANFERGDIQEAVKLLAGDVSEEADLLRLNIFWQTENWTDAARVLRRLAGDPPKDPKDPFPEESARYVLNLAVALKLAHDDQGLSDIRDIYGPVMANSVYSAAFRFIADPTAQGSPTGNLQQTLSQISDGEKFNAFLENYRQKLLTPTSQMDVRTGATKSGQGAGAATGGGPAAGVNGQGG